MLKGLLIAAKAEGYTFHCSYDCYNVDYVGDSVKAAYDAMNACEVMELRLVKDGEVKAWLQYIPELDAEERISDYSGDWMHKYLEEN